MQSIFPWSLKFSRNTYVIEYAGATIDTHLREQNLQKKFTVNGTADNVVLLLTLKYLRGLIVILYIKLTL